MQLRVLSCGLPEQTGQEASLLLLRSGTCDLPSCAAQSWDFGSGFSLLGQCLSTLSEVTVQGLRTATWPFLPQTGCGQGASRLLGASVSDSSWWFYWLHLGTVLWD